MPDLQSAQNLGDRQITMSDGNHSKLTPAFSQDILPAMFNPQQQQRKRTTIAVIQTLK